MRLQSNRRAVTNPVFLAINNERVQTTLGQAIGYPGDACQASVNSATPQPVPPPAAWCPLKISGRLGWLVLRPHDNRWDAVHPTLTLRLPYHSIVFEGQSYQTQSSVSLPVCRLGEHPRSLLDYIPVSHQNGAFGRIAPPALTPVPSSVDSALRADSCSPLQHVEMHPTMTEHLG